MVPYNKDKDLIWQWVSSSVQASISLNQQAGLAYTNLDIISGRVILRCSKAVNIRNITVKLEGESRTRLLGQRVGDPTRKDDTKVSLEYHKILYKVINVFPPADVTNLRDAGKGNFTLPAGSHEYPFQLKIPFNNTCHTPHTNNLGMPFDFSRQGLELVKEPTRHVKKTLPPSLTGFPGEAEISYFVKATIARQGLLNENPRAHAPFNFLPIEPPRPHSTGSQVYARQRHTFDTVEMKPVKIGKMKSLFGGSGNAVSGGSAAPSIGVDIRLPEPAIITCNQILPLSIIVKKLSNSTGMVFLQTLQVSLIAFTKVKAHEFERIEQNSWVIVSRSNMNMALGNATDAEGTEINVDQRIWQSVPLPNTIAPSFETCNISRYYQVDVRVGLSFGGGTKPQVVVLPLRLDTLVFSGIAPPAEVLARMGRLTGHNPSTSADMPQPSNSNIPDKLQAEQGHVPTQPSGSNLPPQDDQYPDAPPSYEDAMAADLPPIDGYRPAYAPAPAEKDSLLYGDEKRP